MGRARTHFKKTELKLWNAGWDENVLFSSGMGEFLNSLRLKHLYERLPREKCSLTTLECGCGSASISALLSRLGNEAIGIDFSRQALRVAKENRETKEASSEFVLGDVENLPFREEVFDVVMSFGLFEHFKRPEIHTREMVRTLKVGGLFFVDAITKRPNLQMFISNPISKIIYYIFTGKRHKPPFEIWMNVSQIREFFKSLPLQNVRVVGHNPFPILAPGFDRVYLKIVLRMKWLYDVFYGSKLALYLGRAFLIHGIKKGKMRAHQISQICFSSFRSG